MNIGARNRMVRTREVPGRALDDRAWIEVGLGNLVRNAVAVQGAVNGARLLPVVKADAYGLGVVPVVRALAPFHPWGFAVATVSEGIALREAGIDLPVLVLMPARLEMLGDYRAHGLRAVLDEASALRAWDQPFHLEIDTGMGRSGVRWDDRALLSGVDSPHAEGAFTHFHSADDDPASIGVQWGRFVEALAQLPRRPALLHAANSAAAWRVREKLDLVRPGLFLYGGRPAADLPQPAPVVALRARVLTLRQVRQGDSVSYGADWRASRDTWIATLGVGYADGVARSLQGRGQVILRGSRRPMVGRVTMDMTMVDLGPDAGHGVQIGDVATLLGEAGEDVITIDEFAAWAGTIPYEMITRLSPRLPRYYLD